MKRRSLIREITPTEIKHIRMQLDRVREIGKKAAKSKRRFADYKYLKAVFAAFYAFGDANLLPILARVARDEYGVARREGCHPLRTIIDASADPKTPLRSRSRWGRALEWAFDQEVQPDGLMSFLNANHGIAGCARLANMALPLYRRPREYAWSDDVPESNGNDQFGDLRVRSFAKRRRTD
ncbi:hypothetical protein L6654_41725 [Bradyrhizobium sp. WYCCWR 13023]|uniref:Uncharacterized protein n=1 Tax=Bradyrhizobium zhengyangense TaxID=2911009 RepID=A0A9X1UFI8_9BRAD|nr:hypothetical protein [Bradyrhizobium zhengyangense]MCG2633073.1 hypothetical protein [Bradyrhizobium zhengyangense]